MAPKLHLCKYLAMLWPFNLPSLKWKIYYNSENKNRYWQIFYSMYKVCNVKEDQVAFMVWTHMLWLGQSK